MAVGADHGPVQTDVAGAHRRHRLQLSGGEVVLGEAVLLVEQLHHRQLHPVGILLVAAADGPAAQQQVQRLARDGLGQGLLALLRAQVGQQIGDDQTGILRVGADLHLHHGAVPQRHHAPQLQGHGDPLVLAQTAVVVGLEIGQLRVLIQGIGLEVQAGRVDVGSGNLHALGQGLLTDVGQQHALVPVAHIHLVPGLQRLASPVGLIARRLRQAHRLCGALPLGLACVQKALIVCAVSLHSRPAGLVHPVVSVAPPAQQLFLQCLIFFRHPVFPP